jgi:hypothetical protein
MSKFEREPTKHEPEAEDAHTQGPSLALLWGLVVLALVVAISFALMIVFPFYHRR